jgi:hypothetical protein
VSPREAVGDELLCEIHKLGDELAVRNSVTHFAIGCASTMVGVVAFGIAMRLLIDSARLPYFFWPIAVLAVACVFLALRGFFKARRLQLCERERFKQYLALRARAGLD